MKKDNLRKEYTDYTAAVKYQRYLLKKGIKSTIYSAYNWREQAEIHTVVPENNN